MNAKRSMDVEKYSSILDWKQFEELAETAFSSFGFMTQRNLRLRKPTMEIDLVASRNGLAFAVDCKHWKRTVGRSTMLGVSELQIKRCQKLLEFDSSLMQIVPLVLTVHDESLHLLDNGTAVVPIHRLSDFILNWEACKSQLCIVTWSNTIER